MHVASFRSLSLYGVILGSVLNVGHSAVLASNLITDANPSLSNPFTTGQVVASNITFSGIGRGLGINGNAGADRYNATSWDTAVLDSTAYFTFTITPNPGYEINFTNLVYASQKSGSGPANFAIRSSVDSFTTNIGSPTATGVTISFGASVFQNITTATEFRFYGWGATGPAGTFSVNDFTFNGTISAIPEPSTYAILFSGAVLASVAVKRRRRSA